MVIGILLVLVFVQQSFASSTIVRITKEELKSMLNDPGIVIIDARRESDWKESHQKIKGAVWEDPDDVNAWAQRYTKDRKIVLYCA